MLCYLVLEANAYSLSIKQVKQPPFAKKGGEKRLDIPRRRSALRVELDKVVLSPAAYIKKKYI